MDKFEQLYLDIQKNSYHQKLELKNQSQKTSLLKKIIGILKEKLGLNSKNSSIPTSKELYKIKKEIKRKSDRKRGGQIGHKGHSRDILEANEIIKIVQIHRNASAEVISNQVTRKYQHRKYVH